MICKKCEFINSNKSKKCSVCGEILIDKNIKNILNYKDELIFFSNRYYKFIFVILSTISIALIICSIFLSVIKNKETLHQQEKELNELEENKIKKEILNKEAESRVITALEEADSLLIETENKRKKIEEDQVNITRKKEDLENSLNNKIYATKTDVKSVYNSKMALEKGVEYKARHILVKTEVEAKKIIAELDKGGDFSKLANKNSLDNKDSQNGGELGWFSASQMVAPFSDAVGALADGEYTKNPVQTQFGFHVILREGSRQ